jgi:hypothetical protein
MSMFRIHQLVRREMFDRIVALSGLSPDQAADALEVITMEMEDDAALAWCYDQGARFVGEACRESWDDAHQGVDDYGVDLPAPAPAPVPVTEVRLFEANGGQLFALAGGRAFLELEFSSSNFAEDAAAIMDGMLDDWTLFVGDAGQVADLLAHPETRFIASYDAAGVHLQKHPLTNGTEYLGDAILRRLAEQRVSRSSALDAHRDFILGDWPEGMNHLWWVATADAYAILRWVQRSSR